MKPIKLLSLSLLMSLAAVSVPSRATEIVMCTDFGPMTIELFDEDAPGHVANFLRYIDEGFYSGTVFHRVVAGFVIQGGGFDRDLKQKRTNPPIDNESRNGKRNDRGTLAAARTGDPHSATSQFYINLVDNPALNATPNAWGYTVFGRVSEGLEVADKIGQLPTGPGGAFGSEVPDPLVAVTSVARIDRARRAGLAGGGTAQEIKPLIAAAIDAGDSAEAFAWLDQYRASCGVIDAEFLLTEARLALALERKQRARAALEEYFSGAEDTDPGYSEALELYRAVTPEGVTSVETGAAPQIATIASHCAAPQVPQIPDGSTASLDEMVSAQAAVRSFMDDSNNYLACLNGVIEGPDITAEQKALLLQEHNTSVGLMEVIAQRFNEQVRIIKARQ
jgi:peptidyl-prolyl cis-trans isomerase B (cyclophilin B)